MHVPNIALSKIVMFFFLITCVALVFTSILVTVIFLFIFLGTRRWKIVALFRHGWTDLVFIPTIFFYSCLFFVCSSPVFVLFFLVSDHFFSRDANFDSFVNDHSSSTYQIFFAAIMFKLMLKIRSLLRSTPTRRIMWIVITQTWTYGSCNFIQYVGWN